MSTFVLCPSVKLACKNYFGSIEVVLKISYMSTSPLSSLSLNLCVKIIIVTGIRICYGSQYLAHKVDNWSMKVLHKVHNRMYSRM